MASEQAVAPHISPILRVGELLFVAGQLATTEGRKLVSGSVAEQTLFVLDKIEALLRAEGADRSHIVKCTAWLQHPEDFDAFNTAYAKFFGEHRPSRSTVGAQLVIAGALVEIEALAVKPR